MCVRCGSRPRWNETFLCQHCYEDPIHNKETAEAIEKAGDGARAYLVKTFHWAGKWSTRG
jgi:hypothetical protein